MKDMQITKISGLILTASVLVGCDLAPNLAKAEPVLQAPTQHWLNDQHSAQQLEKGLTAYLALDDAFLSLASRLYLIRQAKHHLDLQYYMWNDDEIGRMMLAELLKAADRGVKVRLLIDDQNGTQLDPQLQALSQHPNFAIKLFNPYKFRNFRILDYTLRLQQVNHRMHNKLIIADGSIAVTGGRNISREYFDASDDFQFTDLDILFYGTALKAANSLFLDFWNDDLSYSSKQILPHPDPDALNQLRRTYQSEIFAQANTQQRIQAAEIDIQLQLKQRPIQWAKAHFVGDHPDKIRGQAKNHQLISKQMTDLMGQPKRQLELVSAYFVPTSRGAHYLSQLPKQNIKVRVLTNSLVANDVALVHAFYQKYRYPLLKSGVELYEFKPYIKRLDRTWYERLTGNLIPAKGKSHSSLHAKFFDMDGKVFIGSFNFDPRSAHLNSEVGLVLESAVLQQQIKQSLELYLPRIAYQLKLNQHDQIIWYEQQADGSVIQHTHDPETTAFQRMAIYAVSFLPIEWLM